MPSSGLELRPAVHYPQTVRAPSGDVLVEPLGIEGYVTRLHGRGHTRRDRLYLSTLDGHLFVGSASHAHPPRPPFQTDGSNTATINLAMQSVGGTFGAPYSVEKSRAVKIGALAGFLRLLRLQRVRAHEGLQTDPTLSETPDAEVVLAQFGEQEKSRLYEIISRARGYLDLRTITSVQRCGSVRPARPPRGRADRKRASTQADLSLGDAESESTESSSDEAPDFDNDDEGGESGMASAADKQARQARRCFEVETEHGRFTRFEARSILPGRSHIYFFSHFLSLDVFGTSRVRVDKPLAVIDLVLAATGAPRCTCSNERRPSPRDACTGYCAIARERTNNTSARSRTKSE